MVDVFISYQRAERDAVQIIANKLAELGVEVWFDGKLRVGGSYDEEIAKALDASKCVLVCWTPSSIASQWVRAEATAGNNAQKLAACFLEPTQLISPFTIINAADLCRWAGQDDDADWLKTLDAIGGAGRPRRRLAHSATVRARGIVRRRRRRGTDGRRDPRGQ